MLKEVLQKSAAKREETLQELFERKAEQLRKVTANPQALKQQLWEENKWFPELKLLPAKNPF